MTLLKKLSLFVSLKNVKQSIFFLICLSFQWLTKSNCKAMVLETVCHNLRETKNANWGFFFSFWLGSQKAKNFMHSFQNNTLMIKDKEKYHLLIRLPLDIFWNIDRRPQHAKLRLVVRFTKLSGTFKRSVRIYRILEFTGNVITSFQVKKINRIVTLRWTFTTVALYSAVVPG